ncbi:MAG: ThuA domain-containing protein, partial [Pseudomonadales bacterium]
DPYMTPEQENAIIRNVRDRGMGLVAFHCSIWNQTDQFAELLGVEPIMHGEIQPVVLKDFNQDHPITSGLDPFFINLDEQFAAILLNEEYTPLFMSEAVHDKRYALGGWCGQYGKGRFVSLLPGHTQFPWRHPEYQKIVWRSAHWAMGNDALPAYPS